MTGRKKSVTRKKSGGRMKAAKQAGRSSRPRSGAKKIEMQLTTPAIPTGQVDPKDWSYMYKQYRGQGKHSDFDNALANGVTLNAWYHPGGEEAIILREIADGPAIMGRYPQWLPFKINMTDKTYAEIGGQARMYSEVIGRSHPYKNRDAAEKAFKKEVMAQESSTETYQKWQRDQAIKQGSMKRTDKPDFIVCFDGKTPYSQTGGDYIPLYITSKHLSKMSANKSRRKGKRGVVRRLPEGEWAVFEEK